MKTDSCDGEAVAAGARANPARRTPAALRRARRKRLSAPPLLDAQSLVDLEEQLPPGLGVWIEIEHAQDRLGGVQGAIDGPELEARETEPGVRVPREAKHRALERGLGIGVAARGGLD